MLRCNSTAPRFFFFHGNLCYREVQKVKKFPASKEPKDLYQTTQELAIGPYPKPVQSSPHLHTICIRFF